jgi:hypothetical protein
MRSRPQPEMSLLQERQEESQHHHSSYHKASPFRNYIANFCYSSKFLTTSSHTPYSRPPLPNPSLAEPRTIEVPANTIRQPPEQHHIPSHQHTLIFQKPTNTIPPLSSPLLLLRPLRVVQIRTRQPLQTIYPKSRVRSAWCFQFIASGLDTREEESSA